MMKSEDILRYYQVDQLLDAICLLKDDPNDENLRKLAIYRREEIIKSLIALEIIKDKKVNLEYLKCCENYEQYKTICSYWNEITQEEFDLLKEVLK